MEVYERSVVSSCHIIVCDCWLLSSHPHRPSLTTFQFSFLHPPVFLSPSPTFPYTPSPFNFSLTILLYLNLYTSLYPSASSFTIQLSFFQTSYFPYPFSSLLCICFPTSLFLLASCLSVPHTLVSIPKRQLQHNLCILYSDNILFPLSLLNNARLAEVFPVLILNKFIHCKDYNSSIFTLEDHKLIIIKRKKIKFSLVQIGKEKTRPVNVLKSTCPYPTLTFLSFFQSLCAY